MNPSPLVQFLTNSPFAYLILFWTIVWKGLALWKAAGKKQLPWFVIIMIVNTMGLLEIAYIFYLNRFDLDKGKILNLIESKFTRKI